MTREEDLLDPNLFRDSLQASRNARGYLGDVDFVGSLLRLYAQACLEASSSEDENVVRILALAKKYGSVFLGSDSRYSVVPKWNDPKGGLVTFLREWCGIADGDPEEVVSAALLKLASEIFDVAALINNNEGLLDEQWQVAVIEIIERYAFLFVGLSPVARDVAEVRPIVGEVQDE